MLRKLFNTTNEFSFTILRLGLGVVFFAHHMNIPAPLAYLAIAAEFLGGLGLILGLLGRVAAFGILCNMVVAVITVHWQNGLFMNWAGTQKGEGFEYHILAIVICLVLMREGSGALSFDRMLTRR
jgi:putative oxidoreductase